MQGSNPGLLHCRQMLYSLSHQAKVKHPPNYEATFLSFQNQNTFFTGLRGLRGAAVRANVGAQTASLEEMRQLIKPLNQVTLAENRSQGDRAAGTVGKGSLGRVWILA